MAFIGVQTVTEVLENVWSWKGRGLNKEAKFEEGGT